MTSTSDQVALDLKHATLGRGLSLQPVAQSARPPYHRAMELLDIRRTESGRLRACLAYAGGIEQLEGTLEQVDELGRALAHAAALASVSTGACLIADVTVGVKLVRIGLTGAGRVTVVIGPAD
jgi:hypothetical protein